MSEESEEREAIYQAMRFQIIEEAFSRSWLNEQQLSAYLEGQIAQLDAKREELIDAHLQAVAAVDHRAVDPVVDETQADKDWWEQYLRKMHH